MLTRDFVFWFGMFAWNVFRETIQCWTRVNYLSSTRVILTNKKAGLRGVAYKE